MTLQEKFENAPIVYDANLNFIKDYEGIADEFAIGFVEWYLDLWNRNNKSFDNNSPKELLEIYKKEKGL